MTTKAATKTEKARMARIVELGCVACRKEGLRTNACGFPTAHHLLDGGVRRGHAFTICLGRWHHQGDPPQRLDGEAAKFLGTVPSHPAVKRCVTGGATKFFGPSLYHDARAFHARYGSDDELLAYQNKLLEDEK